MRKIYLILFLILAYLAIAEKSFPQYLYKWVDEKGTLHLSDSPPPKTPDKETKQTSTENTAETLKKLEFGKREIPDDMKKYGPGGGGVARSTSSEQTRSSSGTSGKSSRVSRG